MSWLKHVGIPHVFALLTFMVLLSALATWIVPSTLVRKEGDALPAPIMLQRLHPD